MISSKEEEVARDFIESLDYECIVCVVDATNLERNLNLVLQIAEITDRIVVLLNLCDEAKKRNIRINCEKLSEMLGVPVVKATARSGRGINHLLEAVHNIVTGNENPKPNRITYISPIEQAVAVLELVGVKRYQA